MTYAVNSIHIHDVIYAPCDASCAMLSGERRIWEALAMGEAVSLSSQMLAVPRYRPIKPSLTVFFRGKQHLLDLK